MGLSLSAPQVHFAETVTVIKICNLIRQNLTLIQTAFDLMNQNIS